MGYALSMMEGRAGKVGAFLSGPWGAAIVLATITSNIIPFMLSNDATAKSASIVRAAGSFTIHLNAAATAETRVGFVVFN